MFVTLALASLRRMLILDPHTTTLSPPVISQVVRLVSMTSASSHTKVITCRVMWCIWRAWGRRGNVLRIVTSARRQNAPGGLSRFLERGRVTTVANVMRRASVASMRRDILRTRRAMRRPVWKGVTRVPIPPRVMFLKPDIIS